MSNKDMINIIGGAATINGNLLSSISKMISIILEIGRAIGTSISRYRSGTKCY